MRSKDWIILLFLAALKMALPFLLQHPAYGLHRDEYLYYQQGQHLAWGYLENPALIGVLAKGAALMGGSFFWVKFWPALFGAATLLLTAAIAKELGGKRLALCIAALAIICGGYLRIHFLFQPNFLEIFAWTLSAYFALRYHNKGQNRYLYFLFAALALGLWSKYSVVFFATALFLSLLLTPARKVVLQKHFWLAALLGLVLVLPNLLWQVTHNWPLLHHMQELRETQLQYVNHATFFKEQVLMLLPVAFVWMGGLVWLLRQALFRWVGLTFLICVGLIAALNGKGYYTLGLYPMLLAAGGVWLEKLAGKRQWLRFAVPVCILLLTVPVIPLLLPLQPPQEMAQTNERWGLKKLGMLRWEDLQDHALQQDFADMIGWNELTRKTEAAFDKLPPSEKEKTVVYCRSYGQAGALLYHARGRGFKDKIICDNGTFLLWIPGNIKFDHLLFVGHEMPERNDAVFQQFRSVQVLDSVTNSFSRQYGDKVILFRNATDSAATLANEGLKKMKARFGE